MNKHNNAVKIIITIAAVIFINSCSEGLFNFTEETGNISINFTVDSSSGKTLQNVVYNLSNEQTGDSIRKDCYFRNDSYGQSSECYISRADAGTWKLNIIAYDDAGNIAAESDERFDVELAQTVIVELEYFFDGTNGNIAVNYESPSGSGMAPLVNLENMSALIAGYHISGTPVENTQFATYIRCFGSGFDMFLESLRVQVPDGGYLEYSSGSARALNSIQVEANPGMLGITIPDYTGTGIFSITASDINDTESYIEDDFSLWFDPQSGMATISGAVPYDGSPNITSGMYEKNNSAGAGCYIVYCVDDSNGTNIGGTTPKVFEDPAATTDMFMNGILAAITADVVLVTLDADLTQTDIDDHFSFGITDLSVDNLPGWLFNSFGDRINYIGISFIDNYPF